jgi:release factor glutamine methyltransferase
VARTGSYPPHVAFVRTWWRSSTGVVMARHDDGRAAVVREVGVRLAAGGVPSPDADARWLVDHVVEVAGDPVGCGAALLDGLVARRLRREPLQQIIGRTWFRLLELQCAPGVFVPRPETEIVAGLAIAVATEAATEAAVTAAAGARPAASAEDGAELVRVVEACTGTGAIALSIAVEVPGVTVVAGDVDATAVDLARANLARIRDGQAGPPLAPRTSVSVVVSDLLDGVDPSWRGHLDVLVANPPYLPAADRTTWEPEVADHDPDRALVGGTDGHEVVDALLELAATWLAPGGTVILEIDERRGPDAMAAAIAAGLVDVRIERDLTGADRAIVAQRPA